MRKLIIIILLFSSNSWSEDQYISCRNIDSKENANENLFDEYADARDFENDTGKMIRGDYLVPDTSFLISDETVTDMEAGRVSPLVKSGYLINFGFTYKTYREHGLITSRHNYALNSYSGKLEQKQFYQLDDNKEVILSIRTWDCDSKEPVVKP